jgi:hypothetical protein
MAERRCRLSTRLALRHAGDHHFAARHLPHFKLSKSIGLLPTIGNSATRTRYYHTRAPVVIRWTNKNTPPASKISIHTNRYQSPTNQKSHSPKCTNSINLFENIALFRKEFFAF